MAEKQLREPNVPIPQLHQKRMSYQAGIQPVRRADRNTLNKATSANRSQASGGLNTS